MATESTKLPKFMVTTVAPKPNNSPAKDKDGAYEEGPYTFDSKSTQGTECELPVYLLDLKYDGNLAEDQKGEGTFEGTAVSQTKFTEALAKMGQDLVFYIHGFSVQPRDMITGTNEMQEHFNQAAAASGKTAPFVVPVDWACTKSPLPKPPGKDYHNDQASSAKAGIAIGRFFSSLKRTGYSPKIHVVAHSMGNRVLRYVGKGAVPDDLWDREKLPSSDVEVEPGKSLFKAAPESLQKNKDLFDNLFFVAADIPDTVFESPTVGTKEAKGDDQTDHALKSGIAALSVMSKRMHVLHAARTDKALNASFFLNNRNGRLGSLGPYDKGKQAKVWEAVSNELEDKVGADALYGNVYVKDCKEWSEGSNFGHTYETTPKSVQYYLEYMGTRGQAQA